jgi:hypothetical protein
MSSIQVSTKPSVIAGSKFGPKEVVVYHIPSIDDCLALLPRHLGNYILSFTYAWLEFYLDNLAKKYGHTFVNNTLAPLCIIRGRTTQNRLVLYKNNMAYIKSHNIDRGNIHKRFEKALVARKKEIEDEKRRREIETLKKNFDLQRLNVGSIFIGGQLYNLRKYLVVQKTAKTYYCVKVEIESETESHYTLKFIHYWRGPVKYNIETNVPILEVEVPIKPTKELILKNEQGQYNEAIFTQKTKKKYFMGLFGYPTI